MKIYDCFMFNNELDVLAVRLHELYPVVDHFVIVEANRTHAGHPKPMHFQENRSRFSPFADKIIYVPVYDLPDGGAWGRENFQRNCIARGLTALSDEDLVLVSDADEILRPEVVATLRYDHHDLFGFRHALFYYRFNYANTLREQVHEVWAVGVRGRKFQSAVAARNLKYVMERCRNWLWVRRQNGRIIPHAGWHFSWLGDEAHVSYKLQSYAHQEYNDPARVVGLNIAQLMANRCDHIPGSRKVWEIVELDEYFPSYLVENRDRFSCLIAPGATHRMADFQMRLAWEAHPLSRLGNLCKVAARKFIGSRR
jgi:hypothetical protein